MEISPALALFIDFLATILVQCSYILQKKGHMGVEANNAQAEDSKSRKNGFCTCFWILGFIASAIGAGVNAGK